MIILGGQDRQLTYHEGESGGGSGSGTPPPSGNPATPPPSGTAPPASGAGTQTGTKPEDNLISMTQAQIDQMLKDRLDQQQRAFDRKLKDDEDAATLAKAKEDGKKDEVITAHEKTLAELKPKAELADKLAARINTIIEGEIKDWPEEVKALDPGNSDVEARADWIDKSRALAKRLSTGVTPPNTQLGQRGNFVQSAPGSANSLATQTMMKYKGPGGAQKPPAT